MALQSAPAFFSNPSGFMHASARFSQASSSSSTYSFSQLQDALSDVKIDCYGEGPVDMLSQAFASARGRSRSPLATVDILSQAFATARSRSRSPFVTSQEPCIRRHARTGRHCVVRQSSDPFEVRREPNGPPSTFNDFGLPNLPVRQRIVK